jgi:hypothetical protein
MRKGSLFVLVFVLSAGTMLLAQRGRGGMGNAGAMGSAGSMGHENATGMGRETGPARAGNNAGQPAGASNQQQALKPSQINGGAFQMLERKYPGMTSAQLQDLYKTSGAKNFGQFVSAMVVSKNLGLDYNKVLSGMQTQSLGKTLQSMGVSKDKAKEAITQTHQEIRKTRGSGESGGNS